MTAGDYDLIVVGGGIMGASAALRASHGGMRVKLLEALEIGSGASGVNAGTLSLQIKRVKLMPYALAGHALWERAGDAVGYRRTGGLTLAFTDQEAELLEHRMTLKKEAGAPIDFVGKNFIREKAPALTDAVVAASWCESDGYANSSLTGVYYRALLREAGVDYSEFSPVTGIDPSRDGGFSVQTGSARIAGKRLLLASGFGLQETMAMLGVDIPVRVRINTVSVTERGPKLLDCIVGHATGLLTMKQKTNGTVLIGGGWQGVRDAETGRGEVRADTLNPNLQLAQYAAPGLSSFRLVRTWTGFEANVSDFYPLAGRLPGYDNAFVLGCVRGGYTIGPYIGQLMGDLILGRVPEKPLFDPERLIDTTYATSGERLGT